MLENTEIKISRYKQPLNTVIFGQGDPGKTPYNSWGKPVRKLFLIPKNALYTNPFARRVYQREEEEADVIKRRHDELSQATAQTPSNIEPRIVVEARTRRASATQQHEQPAPKNTKGASPSVQDSRIAKLMNVQVREETDSRVARCIYACCIPFNVVRSPYWQDMIRTINKTPQGYKGPNYEKVRTQLLKNEEELVEDILSPIRSSLGSSRVTIVSDGWTNTRHKPLINIIATSPKRAMFIKAKDCSGEAKDA
eukprot:PITA_15267